MSTIIFKKPSKIPKNQLRKNSEELELDDTKNNQFHDRRPDIDSTEVDQDESLLDTIQSVKRKRYVLNKVKTLHRENRSSEPLATLSQDTARDDPEYKSNQDFGERLQGTFSRKKYSHNQSGDFSDDDNDDHGGSILRQKHKLAMEEFIQHGLESTANRHVPDHDHPGNVMSSTEFDGASSLAPSFQREADVGAGGAVLGGTGIAEVTLPNDSRLQSVKETKQTLSRIEHNHGQQASTTNHLVVRKLLPSSFGEGVSRKKRSIDGDDQELHTSSHVNPKNLISSILHQVESTASTTTFNNICSASSAGQHVRPEDVSNLGRSFAHDFRAHNQERFHLKQASQLKELEMRQGKDTDTSLEADHGRMGFDAIRKSGRGFSNTQHKLKNTKDDEFYRNFVKRAKEKRK